MTEAPNLQPKRKIADRLFRRAKSGEPTILPTGYVPEVRRSGFEPKPLAEPTTTNAPLSPVSRSAAENLSNIAAEARANLIPNAVPIDSNAVGRAYEPNTGFRHRRVSGRAVGIAAGLIATAGVAGTAAYLVLNNDSDKAIVTDVGDLGNPTVPSLTTPDGKQVVVGETPTAVPTETPKATPTPEKLKTVAWTAEQIAKAQQEALANNKVAILDTWTENGGEAKYIQNTKGLPLVTIHYKDSTGKIFKAPFSGTVSVGVIVQADGAKIRILHLKLSDGTEMGIYANIGSTVKVQNGQKVAVGDDLLELTGIPLPETPMIKDGGDVLMGDNTRLSLTNESVMKDNAGNIVHLESSKN